jgi:hypothetical protein
MGFLDQIKTVLESDDFKQRHRRSEKDFTRKRSLTFNLVILFLLNMVKRSLQDELDEFFKVLSGQAIALRMVSKSAFTQARQKLNYTAFIELNRTQVTYYETHYAPLRWHGMRLLAMDGSMVQLPRLEAIGQHFGVWHPASGGECPKARLSQMFDVLNKLTIDAIIAPKKEGERALAAQHCQFLTPDDLVLLDRGYPAFWLFALILSQQAHFCARMSVGEWQAVIQFLASEQKEALVTLTPSYESAKECRRRGLSTAPIQVRLIRIELDNGEVEVLATSLLDTVRFPHALFKDLYHQRWPVEEDYKVMKSRLEIENWSGTSVAAIYQDFHAAVFTKNFATVLSQPAQQTVADQKSHCKYRYYVNLSNLLSKLKDTLLSLLTANDPLPWLEGLWQQMIQTVEPFRPGRSVPRKKRVRPRKFAMNYKPLR